MYDHRIMFGEHIGCIVHMMQCDQHMRMCMHTSNSPHLEKLSSQPRNVVGKILSLDHSTAAVAHAHLQDSSKCTAR